MEPWPADMMFLDDERQALVQGRIVQIE